MPSEGEECDEVADADVESSDEIISCGVTPTCRPNRTSFSSLLCAAKGSASLSSKFLDWRTA